MSDIMSAWRVVPKMRGLKNSGSLRSTAADGSGRLGNPGLESLIGLARLDCRRPGGDSCQFLLQIGRGPRCTAAPILFGPSFAVASLSLQLLSTCAADMGSKWVR